MNEYVAAYINRRIRSHIHHSTRPGSIAATLTLRPMLDAEKRERKALEALR